MDNTEQVLAALPPLPEAPEGTRQGVMVITHDSASVIVGWGQDEGTEPCVIYIWAGLGWVSADYLLHADTQADWDAQVQAEVAKEDAALADDFDGPWPLPVFSAQPMRVL